MFGHTVYHVARQQLKKLDKQTIKILHHQYQI